MRLTSDEPADGGLGLAGTPAATAAADAGGPAAWDSGATAAAAAADER
ncbi:hypothetical protein [Arthrobacter sp. efr-133-R2A-120]|nr:hypothetical protein [Arthrobacter sp. efr-133-R2A-120]